MKLGNKRTEGLRPSPLGVLLQQKGITETQLAKEVGLHRSTVVKYVWNGMETASGWLLMDLADYFGCTTDYLLGRGQ